MLEPYTTQSKIALKKAKGQLEKALSMLEEGRYCMDIIQQSNAALGLIKSANLLMLESHLKSCGIKLASLKKDEQEKFIKEIIRACSVSSRKA